MPGIAVLGTAWQEFQKFNSVSLCNRALTWVKCIGIKMPTRVDESSTTVQRKNLLQVECSCQLLPQPKMCPLKMTLNRTDTSLLIS